MAIKSAGTFLKISEIASEFNDPTPNAMSEFYRGAGKVCFHDAGKALKKVLKECPKKSSKSAQTGFKGKCMNPVAAIGFSKCSQDS